MSMYRLGRHNKQLVYYQWGLRPTDDDPLVAVFFSKREAEWALGLLNKSKFRDEEGEHAIPEL